MTKRYVYRLEFLESFGAGMSHTAGVRTHDLGLFSSNNKAETQLSRSMVSMGAPASCFRIVKVPVY